MCLVDARGGGYSRYVGTRRLPTLPLERSRTSTSLFPLVASPTQSLMHHQLGIAFGILGTFAYSVYMFAPESPATPRSYPFNGLEKEMGGRNAARPEEENVDDE